MLQGIYQAIYDVFQLPPIILGGNDFTPLIVGVATALVTVVSVANLFALIRCIFFK